MEKNLGPPLAYGRTAEIYAWDDGHILKLFYDWFGRESIEYEAKMGRAVHASGLPVPAVREMVQVNGRSGLIYERMMGVSLWDVLPRKPWTVLHFGRRMAALHAEMHVNPLRPEIPRQRQRLERKIMQAAALPEALRAQALAALAALPDGEAICHGDFHPGNVLTGPQGEVVIDWIDASLGNPLADVARTSILALGAAATVQTQNAAEKLMVRLFHWAYLRHYFALRPGGREEYGRWLPIVAAARLSENIPEIEQWLLAQAEKVAD